jgi:hypothetical protein
VDGAEQVADGVDAIAATSADEVGDDARPTGLV